MKKKIWSFVFFFKFSIWEKFLVGSEYIFVFLTIHILLHCRLKLLSLHSTKEIMQYLVDLKVRFYLNNLSSVI